MSETRRSAQVFVDNILAGELVEHLPFKRYDFQYHESYRGPPISLTMPVRSEPYIFEHFPPFFDGLLPEGPQLEALLRQRKIDKNDLFSQLLAVGEDLVGNVTVAVKSQ